MSITEKLKDSELPPKEETAIIGAFVRRQKREALGARWAQKLSSEHNVKRSHLRVTGEKTPRQRRRLLWILPAAAAAILFLVLLLPQLQGGESRTEVIASILLETEIDKLRGGETNDFTSLQAAFAREYNARNYAAAITTGEQIIAHPAAQPEDRLNLGLAYLNAEQLLLAEAIFQKLLADIPQRRTETSFYLALTQLERGQKEDALELLRSIQPSDGGAWYRKAQRVLSAN